MAEPVSILLAAAGITSIFTSCLECFEYIQLGQNFGKDYQRSLLRLDLVRLRLSRWWESLHTKSPSAQFRFRLQLDSNLMRNTLEDITDHFAKAENLSRKYQLRVSSELTNLAVCNPETDLAPGRLGLHTKLRDMARRRQKGTGSAKKVKWALYDHKRFDQLIENITDRLDSLVELYPIEEIRASHRELCDAEVNEIQSESDLEALREIAPGVDNIFENALQRAIETRGGHRDKSLTVLGAARVENGDFVSQGAVISGPGNEYHDIIILGDCRVRNGTNYGGRGVFD